MKDRPILKMMMNVISSMKKSLLRSLARFNGMLAIETSAGRGNKITIVLKRAE
jgi:hypothetical protein